MSFASAVKNELCRLETNEECCLLAELASVIRVSGDIGRIREKDAVIRIVTENAAFARRIFSTVKKLFNIYPEVSIRKSSKLKKHISYILYITVSSERSSILDGIGIGIHAGAESGRAKEAVFETPPKSLLRKSCCRKSYLRGAFLAAGSVSDPEKTYHLEIAARSLRIAGELSAILGYFRLHSRVIKRKGYFVVYLKEGENIADFLNITGAHSALMELENVRILKEMRNNVNRIVNCETANLDKTVNASVRQIENIKYIQDTVGFSGLPESLRHIAELRLAYDSLSLKELGEMTDPPLGKSGVNHRLRKLDRIAEKMRGS